MYHRTLHPIEKHFSRVLNCFKANSFHASCERSLKADNPLARQLESILQSCIGSPYLREGKQVHAQSIVNGIINNGLLGAKILGVYVACDRFIDAKKLFHQLEFHYAMPWNWMIRGCIKKGFFDFALLFYFKMLACGVCPDKYTFPAVIKACAGVNAVRLAKMVHDTISSVGFDVDAFMGSSLIKLYLENDCIDDARRLFDKLSYKDSVLWNVMLNGLVNFGELDSAIEMFRNMRNSGTKPDSVTFACLLSICASEGMIEYGIQLHGLAVCYGLQFEPPVANTLVAMYSKCGYLFDAQKVFDMIPHTDLVAWNGMVAGYVQNGFMVEASQFFKEMISGGVKPDSTTFSSFLPSVTDIRQAKEIHGYTVRHGVILDVFLKSALIDMYFKCRDVTSARNIFDLSTVIDIVMSTAMISGYVLNGMSNDGLEVFRWLIKAEMRPNAVTYASVLPACADLAALKLGREMHNNLIRNGLDRKRHVGSAIMDMYAKCGRLDLAHQIFIRMSDKDVVCWNSLVTSCARNGKPEEAIDLLRKMGIEGLTHNCVSISAGLSACANLPALHHGKEIHCLMIKGAFDCDIFAESALIDMYAKCGNLNAAYCVFDLMKIKNEVSWNSIIAAYGNHGHLDQCLALFHKMLDNGFEPDHVTFLGILSACGHVGQVDDGVRYFRWMTDEFGIPAGKEHYSCMVDLFARAGRLNEAFETIKSMSSPPDAGIWGTLLGACRVHGNVELAEVASRHLLDLDPKNSGYYVLLSNIHADAGQWGSVRKIRNLMKERGVQKVPGYSWIEVNNATHMFTSSDTTHPESAQIYSLLKDLLFVLRKEGHVLQPLLPSYPQACIW
ncbi:hypothetical protein K2173_000534 [Erythroxylum novogranatense]|uniref:Pentatricopeptide repeat-containing protein n=1 Tax=Erythroxylum novogranatense TaxID=1862640 RepID=A0AAV8SXJ1_9ROSI|nr:hypothetical protein K2173_000534 [Erythroxylum novogranatense]